MIHPVRSLLPLAIIGTLAGPAVLRAAPAPTDTAAAILDANRRATGPAPAGTLKIRYFCSGQGMTGTSETILDTASGAFIESHQIGPTSGASGFDGRTPWWKDLSGTFTPQQGGDKLVLAVNEAYRGANLWWRPGRGGAAIDMLGRDADGDHLRVTPPGGKEFDVWFDPVVHLLVRIREVQGFHTIDQRYNDFAQRAGMTVPITTIIDDGNGPTNLQTLRLTSLEVAPSRRPAAYAMPTAAPSDWAIDGGAHEVTVPFRLLNNHIFVDATVNGRGPFPFLVDTGGHDILTNPTVQALGLASQGEVQSNGAGEKTASTGYTRVREIDIGGVRMSDQTVLTLDFSPKEVEGFQIGGMLGLELFRRFAVRIDYGAERLTMIDPAHFDPKDAGIAVPFRFYDHLPQVQGRFGDIPGRFDIDTGARVEVTLTKPFVETRHLRDAYPQGIVTVDGWGVGGPALSYVARAPSLSLGGVTVPGPVASMATQNRGSFTDANYEGNVGSGLLKRFIVTFDYAHAMMYLKPLAQPPADAGTFDRAGLWINLADKGFEIVKVTENGPAAQAGLTIGDVILAIGDDAAAGLSLSDARRIFRTMPVGKAVSIAYWRDGEVRKAMLLPRDQIRA